MKQRGRTKERRCTYLVHVYPVAAPDARWRLGRALQMVLEAGAADAAVLLPQPQRGRRRGAT